jgi:phosphoribosylformimino-5-aminoimidazole carboxamide ribotide isomerase
MELLVRINILDGRSVRLRRGDLNEAIPLDTDPIARAHGWILQGADKIHVVDLDAAAHGDYRNRPLIDHLIAEAGVPVQVAGGIRSPIEASRLIEAGAWRVVMGTAAIEDQNMVWELCRDYPDKIVISLDARADEEIATRGWGTNSGRYLEEVLVEMSSAGATARMVEPPDLGILAVALRTVGEPVIAAGGVRNLEDLSRLMAMNVDGRTLAGVIVGREVTHGRFTIEEAKQLMNQAAPPAGGVVETVVPVVSAGFRETAGGYQRLAEELDRAASHARVAAQHFLDGTVQRGPAHGLAAAGHLSKAKKMLDVLAESHAAGSEAD